MYRGYFFDLILFIYFIFLFDDIVSNADQLNSFYIFLGSYMIGSATSDSFAILGWQLQLKLPIYIFS